MLSDAMGFLLGVIFIAAVIMSNMGKKDDETEVIKPRRTDDLLTDPAYSFLSMNIYHTDDDTHIHICDDDWKY